MPATNTGEGSYECIGGLSSYFKRLSEEFPDEFSELPDQSEKMLQARLDPYEWQNWQTNKVQEWQHESYFQHLKQEDVSCDAWLINFVRLYARKLRPTSILDTSSKTGLLLNVLANDLSLECVDGIEPQKELADHAQLLCENQIRIVNSDISEAIQNVKDQYDLIISDPPLSIRFDAAQSFYFSEKYNVTISSSTALHIYFAAKLLSKNGKLLVPCSNDRLQSLRLEDESDTRGGGLRKILRSLSLSISACITPDVIQSDTWGGDARLLILERQPCDKIFLGRFKTDLKSQKILVDNVFAKRSCKKWMLGSIHDWRDYADIQSVESDKKIKSIAKRSSFLCVAGSDLFVDFEINNQWNEDEHDWIFPNRLLHDEKSLYISLAFEMETDFEKVKPRLQKQWIIHTKVNPSYSSPEFLKNWFQDTVLGQETLSLLREDPGMICPMDNDEVEKVKSIITKSNFYLPDMSYQQKTLTCWSRLESIQGQVDTLREQIKYFTDAPSLTLSECALINVEDGYKEWIGSLPFPLASILWRHYASRESFRLKYKTLIHFFEALSAFLATIHISAFVGQAEVWSSLKEELRNDFGKQRLSIEKASFGSWRFILEKLIGYIKKNHCLEENPQHILDFFADNYGTSDVEIIQMLIQSPALGVLQRANQIRNRWLGHAGALSERQAKIIHDELFELVQNVRSIFKRIWLRYQLLEPMALTYKPGLYSVTAKRMMGIASSPFEEIEFSSDIPLCSGELYLFDTTNRSGLHLQPLIKVAPSPEKNVSACFIYNRKENDGVRMISYHFDQESEILSKEERVSSVIENIFL